MKTARGLKGFTLVELLVVIAIIAILAAVVVLIINPLELIRRGRDSTRLSDFANLQTAINVTVQEATGTGVLCGGAACTTAVSGKSTDANARLTDGTGWVKVNLGAQNSLSVPTLPIDPNGNNTTNHYTYCGGQVSSVDAYIMKTVLESVQQIPKMSTDGDLDNNTYSVSSNPSLACAY